MSSPADFTNGLATLPKKNKCCTFLKETSIVHLDKSLYLDGRLKYVPGWAVLLSVGAVGLISIYVFDLCS